MTLPPVFFSSTGGRVTSQRWGHGLFDVGRVDASELARLDTLTPLTIPTLGHEYRKQCLHHLIHFLIYIAFFFTLLSINILSRAL